MVWVVLQNYSQDFVVATSGLRYLVLTEFLGIVKLWVFVLNLDLLQILNCQHLFAGKLLLALLRRHELFDELFLFLQGLLLIFLILF